MSILRRIANLFHRSELDEEIEAELRSHIEMRTADNLAAGMSPREARREALLRFGNRVVLRERVTEADAHIFLDSLWQDLRYGLRMLRKSPGFTAVAVLTLALGIGANTAIFSLANAAFFRALPYRHAEQLAFLWQNNLRSGELEGTVSYPNFADWRAQSHSFEDMAFISGDEILLGKGGVLQHVSVGEVSTNFLSVLGASPLLGRDFTYSDALPGSTHVLLIGYNLWQTYYGGDPHIIGRPVGSGLSANSLIIGVMPRGFSFPPGTEVWKPREADNYLRTKSRLYPFFRVIGRLHAGVKWSSAQAEMDTIANRLASEYPAIDGDIGIHVVPLREQLSQNVRQGLPVLWAAILGILLIACVNAANLILARACSRQKEIAVRFSLGATRSRIIRQFLAESFILSAAGAVAGFFLASWAIALVSKFNPDIARLDGGILDVRVLLYTIAIVVFTALVCAILPALSSSRFELSRAFRETSSASSSGHFMRKILIVSEVSLAFILLAGSGLLIRSLWKVLSVNPGLDANHLLALNLRVPWTSEWPEDSKLNAIYRGLIARLRTLPDVVSVGSTSKVLFPDEMFRVTFVVEDQPTSPGQWPFLPRAEATPDYFRTAGIPLLRGRFFTDADTAENAQPVAIINETMANRYWPNADPLGKAFKVDDPILKKSPWFTIVGVVGDVRRHGFESSAGLMAYFPSVGNWSDDVVIRAVGIPAALIPEVRNEIRTVSANFGIDRLLPVSAILSGHESQRKFNACLLGAFAFLALALAAVGIYGSIAYWVKQWTQEIGVRIALGASPHSILSLVICRGLAVTFVGLAIGFAGALGLTRLITTMLFQVRPEDALTYGAVALLFAVVAFAACYVPARRATRVDPMVALRYE